MDFAADAVLDANPPPTRPAPARAAASGANEPSFEDHLDAVTAAPDDTADDDAPTQTVGKADAEKPDAASKAEANSGNDTSAANVTQTAPQQQSAEPSAPPLFVQIVAPPVTTAPTPQITTPPETATPLVAPTSAAPIAAPTTPATQTGDAGANAAPVPSAKSAPLSKTGAAPDAAQSANTAAPVQANAQAQAPTTAPPAQPQPPAQNAEIVETPVLASAPVRPIPEEWRAALTSNGKVDSRHAEKGAAVEFVDAPQAPAPSANAATGAKSTASNPAGKEGPSAIAPQPAASQEAPAPAAAQQGASAIAQPAAQTQNTSADHSQVARAAPAAAQVAREVVRHFNGENTRFELRLDPPELGRVDVRLDVSRDHRVTAVIAADSPQALNELARHARDLEQMLQSAGLELSDSGLSFDLRQGGKEAAEAGESFGGSEGGDVAGDVSQQQSAPAARPLGFERWRGVRVDLRV